MGKYSITKTELLQEVESCKKQKEKIIRIPVLTNIRMANGKLVYEVEDYLEMPAHYIPRRD
jgi:hypothetical protein